MMILGLPVHLRQQDPHHRDKQHPSSTIAHILKSCGLNWAPPCRGTSILTKANCAEPRLCAGQISIDTEEEMETRNALGSVLEPCGLGLVPINIRNFFRLLASTKVELPPNGISCNWP